MADFARRLGEIIERDMNMRFMETVRGLTCTNQVAPEPAPFDLDRALREWDELLRESRKTQVVFKVDLTHEGPILKHETPHDGTVFEMSFLLAREVHHHWPLKLRKILSAHAAEFVPASQFDTYFPANLPLPPFDAAGAMEDRT